MFHIRTVWFSGAGDEDREGRVLERLAELETRDSIGMSPQGANGISTMAPTSLHRRALQVIILSWACDELDVGEIKGWCQEAESRTELGRRR
ncbi:hypothetical protein M405DRAFT_825203 [Rhizopogon salebrosus TDB-379]|nr:hypothetical protein M405DRAFT_825203 [Rhizopogon salebrosus TDB-379]